MESIFGDSNLTETYQNNLHSLSELNSTLKKCQSLIIMQKNLIGKNNSKLNSDDHKSQSNINFKAYDSDIDNTKKENEIVRDNRIKHYFNIYNYEQKIKNETFKKDMSKTFLGLTFNDGNINNNSNNDKEFSEFIYDFKNRKKQKEGLLFLKNFFSLMKLIKNNKKKKDKSIGNPIKLNKFKKFFFQDNNKIKKKVMDKEINLILERIKIRYSPLKTKIKKENEKINSLTETSVNSNNNSYNYNNYKLKEKMKYKILRKKNSLNYNYNNNINQRFNTENNDNKNKNNHNKYFFPKINNNSEIEKNIYNTISTEYSIKKTPTKNIGVNFSDNNIFNKKKILNRNNSYFDKLKKIYKSKNKKKNTREEIINNNKINNFEMPKLLKFKEKPLFKKNNHIFFSPIHYDKYEQMRRIKDKILGIYDKEVFKVYNQKI